MTILATSVCWRHYLRSKWTCWEKESSWPGLTALTVPEAENVSREEEKAREDGPFDGDVKFVPTGRTNIDVYLNIKEQEFADMKIIKYTFLADDNLFSKID